jgi:putative nucleotidyltransferase with HDIG domain
MHPLARLKRMRGNCFERKARENASSQPRWHSQIFKTRAPITFVNEGCSKKTHPAGKLSSKTPGLLPAIHCWLLNLEKRMPTRLDAWKLLCEFTESESLRKHMLAVEACVRAYARKQGADEDTWSLAALLHDFDYERWPNNEHAADAGHPAEGAKILRERGYSEEIVRAILSHADYSGVVRQSPLEHTLFACDELAGFLTACSYVRPSKSILDLEVDSVKRRLKDKAFAKGVSREDVRKGAEELGIPLEEHIGFCISAMREEADALGLRGNVATQGASS